MKFKKLLSINTMPILLCFLLSMPILHSAQIDKKEFMQSIIKDPAKKNMWFKRALLTISCDDSDYIPKVPGAGNIFEENGKSYQLMHNGVKIITNCYYGYNNWMTDIIYGLRGHHEPQEEKAFYEVLKSIPKNATMLELGSYWGYYSLWFLKQTPNASAYLIEPNPKNLEVGKNNFLLNNAKGKFYNYFIGNTKPNHFKKIKSIKIDDFLSQENIDHVNILHSDIQGAEHDMLLSCINSVRSNKIDYFFISTHSEQVHKKCSQFLLNNRFDVIVEHTPAESYSCDGLIVGKRQGVKGPNEIKISKHNLRKP